MTEQQTDYRTKGERIAYIKAEIERLKEVHTESWKEEILTVCVKALENRIEEIICGCNDNKVV